MANTQLRIMPPEILLDQIAKLAPAASGEARPDLVLYLTSGPTLRGQVVGAGNGMVMLFTTEDGATLYVRMDQVAAMSVLPSVPARGSVRAIARGTAAPEDGDTVAMRRTPLPPPPPSRLDLMRQANTHADMMSNVLGHEVEIFVGAPLDENARREVLATLPLVSDVVLALAGEPGRAARFASLRSIELVAGAHTCHRPDPSRLVVRCAVGERFTAGALRDALARLFSR